MSARRQLTRVQLAEIALAFLDEHGLDALSMRRLAEHAGVGTMTLYGYFSGKDDLLDAVVDAAVRDRSEPDPADTWQEQLRALMIVTRRGLELHPALVKVRADRPVLRPEALRFAESTVGILRGAGFAPGDAAGAFRLLFTYVLGYVSFSPSASAEQARARAREALGALPAVEYPAVSEARRELADAMAGDRTFEFGLDRIIDGLEAQVPRDR